MGGRVQGLAGLKRRAQYTARILYKIDYSFPKIRKKLLKKSKIPLDFDRSVV